MQPNNNNNNIDNDEGKFVEDFWVENILPNKVQTLPYNKLSKQEQNIIDKVNNNTPLTSEEITIIKQTTATYGEALEKYDAVETIEAYENFTESIINEQELLDLVEQQSKPQELIMNCHFNQNGKVIRKPVKFTIHPIDDSRAVQITQLHSDIYQSLTDQENSILIKQQKGEKLSKAEQDVIDHINEKVMEDSMEDRMRQINILLANQVTPPTKGTIEEKAKFWEKFHFNDKMSLFLRVEDMLGLTESFDSELFLDE